MTQTVATRPRRSAVEILPREAFQFDRDLSSFDRTAIYWVRSRSCADTARKVRFEYRDGSWSCDCPAGANGKRCAHQNTVQYWTVYDRTRRDLERMSDAALRSYDRDFALVRAGLLAPWLHWQIDADACGDEIAARVARQNCEVA